MAKNRQQLFEEALRLPPEARAEIQRRLHEVDSGAVKAVPWSEARKRILEGT